MKIETILFDLDGTLLDTLEDLTAACNYALRSVNAPERTLSEVRRFVGNGLGQLMTLALPNGKDNPDYDRALSTLQTYYQAHNQERTCPYAGVVGLVEELHRRGYPLAIVSNKPDTSVKMLNDLYFAQAVSVAIGEREGVRRKPAPDTVFQALRELDRPLSTALYIGDSEVDLLTARNAGLPCLSVTWGFRDRKLLEENGAQFFADTVEDVLDFVEAHR